MFFRQSFLSAIATKVEHTYLALLDDIMVLSSPSSVFSCSQSIPNKTNFPLSLVWERTMKLCFSLCGWSKFAFWWALPCSWIQIMAPFSQCQKLTLFIWKVLSCLGKGQVCCHAGTFFFNLKKESEECCHRENTWKRSLPTCMTKNGPSGEKPHVWKHPGIGKSFGRWPTTIWKTTLKALMLGNIGSDNQKFLG